MHPIDANSVANSGELDLGLHCLLCRPRCLKLRSRRQAGIFSGQSKNKKLEVYP